MTNTSEERLATADFVLAGNEAEKRDLAAKASAPESQNGSPGTLLAPELVQDMRNRWGNIQAGFVDEPRAAVKQADEMVALAMKRLAEGFAEQRNTLEQQWSRGGDVSTEDLRMALKKYRSFFDRLLAVQAAE